MLVFGPGPPVPGQDIHEGLDRDVFEEGEDLDHLQAYLGIVGDRRGREAAIAVDRSGDAVARHRIQSRRPPHRRVEMIVSLDETWGDVAAAGIDHTFARTRLQTGADLHNEPVTDSHIDL